MLISIDFTWFLHIFPFHYVILWIFFCFSYSSFLFSPIRRKLASFSFFFIPLTPNLASSWKVINYSKALLQCRCTFVYQLRQCLSYWNLFSSSKGGKLREYSKQFILWCKLISLPSDPKLIYQMLEMGIYYIEVVAIYVYMLLRIIETHKTWNSFPNSIVMFSFLYFIVRNRFVIPQQDCISSLIISINLLTII